MSNPSIEYANPDYGDYTYRKWTLVTIFAVLCGMSSIVVLLRFYTRLVISKYFGRDDWWMLVAWLLGLGNVACWISYLELGSWKHGSDLSLESVKPLFKNLWVLQWIYPIATGVLKLSVLAFYLRVFEGQSKRFRALVYGHVVDYWDMFNPARNCMNSESLLYAASGIILVTDVSILILPMKHLWRLRIPTQQKVQVVFLVGLGAVTCIASSCRVYYLWVMTESDDRTYDGFEYSYWTAIELWVGIAVTCLPPCKPAFARLFGCGSQARSHYFDNSYITQESYMSGEPSRESRGGYNSAVSSDTRGMHSRSHEEMISFHKSAPLTAEEATEFRS
ncbi:hypothetical protein BJ875DRAFT_480193 [Amylocarpus encephaloides]|uniref:Rhodopsin domain-containing protein n=1 Tax=Amylocarpus encephaloides TaxID=45428 RepID=A0A9P8C9B5_9HELO|nr:hypothetical protein BJ875DRAFT_480193 [Amylocarpus encephaloides]